MFGRARAWDVCPYLVDEALQVAVQHLQRKAQQDHTGGRSRILRPRMEGQGVDGRSGRIDCVTQIVITSS